MLRAVNASLSLYVSASCRSNAINSFVVRVTRGPLAFRFVLSYVVPSSSTTRGPPAVEFRRQCGGLFGVIFAATDGTEEENSEAGGEDGNIGVLGDAKGNVETTEAVDEDEEFSNAGSTFAPVRSDIVDEMGGEEESIALSSSAAFPNIVVLLSSVVVVDVLSGGNTDCRDEESLTSISKAEAYNEPPLAVGMAPAPRLLMLLRLGLQFSGCSSPAAAAAAAAVLLLILLLLKESRSIFFFADFFDVVVVVVRR